MQVFYRIEDFQSLPNAVVTIGTFDGVHKGHQKILRRLKAIAQETAAKTVVITFYPHPRSVVSSDNKMIKLLSTMDEKVALLENYGVDYLLVIPFTREFSELSSENFIQKILIDTIGTKKLVIGYDHKFGKNREGSFENVKANSHKYSFEIEEISREDIDSIGISSTKIRNAVLQGDVKLAQHYLGNHYSISGLVVKGKQLGRTIGFPTANVQVREQAKLIPADGVYAVKVLYKTEWLNGMLNIGVRPTVDGQSKTVEVYIFDFDRDIYGENITLQFVEKVREEMKFDGLNALKNQIEADGVQIRKILNS
ncbi:MAG: bifunctional riboflavin kinase/FAD synthetase [Pseudarcicella sp.]|nr:bifunctional riboflavin kinase/FAD synthetase [Pseudarcicella sp.]